MAARRNAPQIDAIDALLPGERTVTVRGQTLTLAPPSEAGVRRLRRIQYALASRDGSEPSMDALADGSLDLATEALRACIPGLDRKRAFRLVLASGGEAGELSRAALGLCGIGEEFQAALEDAGDLPS